MFSLDAFKKFFFYSLIGSLVLSSLLAVIAVLIGEFTDLSIKLLFTLVLVVVHSFVSLGFVWGQQKNTLFPRSIYFMHLLFFFVVVSFLTSILGVWDVVSGRFVGRMYLVLFTLFISANIVALLSRVFGKTQTIDNLTYGNMAVVGLVTLLLIPIILFNSVIAPFPLYYRIVAALSIIAGTLTVLVVLFYRIYLSNHPKEKSVYNVSILSIAGFLFLAYIVFGLFFNFLLWLM